MISKVALFSNTYELIEACREATSNIPLLWTVCVSEMTIPSIQAIVPHRGGSILCSIMNLSQFRVPCCEFYVKLYLRDFSKALCKLQEDKTIYFQVVSS